MAENENGQEQSEEPTAKRLRDAREKGQVARSREFNTLVILIAGGAYFKFLGAGFAMDLMILLKEALTFDRQLIFETGLLVAHLQELMTRAMIIIAPLFILMMAIAILGPILIGGANFSAQAFSPKFSKLNPLTGMKRLFSVQGLLELIKALSKFTLVSVVSWMAISNVWNTLMNLGELPIDKAIMQTGDMAVTLFLIASASLLVVALIDVPFQLWTHNKQLRMTLQEIKDEYKESDGKPEVKGRIRQLQQEMARQRMMSEVPKADVIITNPTHYAVALTYQSETMSAPLLLAKGIDETAQAIRELATEHHITQVQAPKVARAIYFTTEIGQEIPNGLFVAVARLLAYVYQLKQEDAEDVTLPDDLPVPDEYLDQKTARRIRR
ncbi:flagellar biosynthesis protein FlhB [Chromatium weissei]|nr:flagellar biosynthesis protein FlhB [Chromatium weissei]